MSHPAAASHKRPATAPVDGVQPAAQWAQLDAAQGGEEGGEAAADAAAPASSSSATLSPAQRCAADTLAAAFAFLPFEELPSVLRVCRAWLAAAAKETPRGRCFDCVDLLSALCASRSPLRRHFSAVDLSLDPISLEQLQQMVALPFLLQLHGTLGSADLEALLAQGRESALSQLRAAFPPRLETLSLYMQPSHVRASFQLQLDVLPSLPRLNSFDLLNFGAQANQFASLSLDPLLQVPQLSSLGFADIDELSVEHLGVVKRIAFLRELRTRDMEWSVEQLAALCRPPHRLQQLEEFGVGRTSVGAAHMAELIHLPALAKFAPQWLLPGAYTFLPRLTRLRDLRISLDQYADASLGESQRAVMDDALRACPLVVSLTMWGGSCIEAVGTRLLQSLPHLRELRVRYSAVPSLRFLQHAPHLDILDLFDCTAVRPAHLALLGHLVPQLTCLRLYSCHQLHLDEFEVQSLTPPSRLLPLLTDFSFQD